MNLNLLKLLKNITSSLSIKGLNDNKLLLKALLLELNKYRLYNNINNNNINKYINDLSNKGNKLQHLNNINT